MEHCQAAISYCILDFNFPRPSSQFWVFAKIYRSIGVRNKARSILVSRNISHRMMVSIYRKALAQNPVQIFYRAVIFRESGNCCIVEIEIKLGIEQTATYITVN